MPWSPEINKSDGWTSGATGSAGVSAGDPDGGAGCAGYARLGAWIRVGDDGRVKNCAAHDDTKSSVESEVTQSWRVFSPGCDESAGAGAGPPGVSTEGSTQEQGSQDTDLLMKQNTLNPKLFLAVWPVVNQWIREGLEAELDRRGRCSILRRCWLVWAQDILPPPLVLPSSDDEVGIWRGTRHWPRAGGLGDSSPSSSDSESDAHGVSAQMHPAEIVIMKCFRS